MDTIKEFNLFLINRFSSKEEEWTKYLPMLGANFIKTFNQNLTLVKSQLNILVNRKQKKLSTTEHCKLILILNIIQLYKWIKIDENNNDNDKPKINVDYKKINSYFKLNTNQKQIENFNKAKNELEKVEKNYNSSFEELWNEFKFLISFIKEEEFRKYFYEKIILKSEEIEFTNKLNTTNNYINC